MFICLGQSAYALDKVFASTILVVIFSLMFVGIVQAVKKVVIRHRLID
ncbi:ABC-type transport system, permease domain protein [Clostridioides difficile DA00165]|nr:ABC-type transport system, permease domain protein [Clostridioides difficile DA00165]